MIDASLNEIDNTKQQIRPKNGAKKEFLLQAVVFLLAVTSLIGNNYGSNLESITQVEMEKFFDIHTLTFNNVLIMRSLGVTIFTLMAPIFLETIGFRKTYLSYVCLTFFGSLVCNTGIWTRVFTFVLVGKMIFAGAEIVASLQFEIFSRWFDEKKVPLMIGFVYTFTRFIKTLGGFLIPYFAANYEVILSMCPFISWKEALTEFPASSSFLIWLMISFVGVFAAIFLLELDTLKKEDYDISHVQAGENDKQFVKIVNKFSQFPKSSILLFLGIFCGFSCVNGFLMNCSKMYKLRFGYTLQDVGSIVGLYTLFTGISSMVVGWILYKCPYYIRTLQIIAGTLVMIHVYFLIVPDSNRNFINILPMAFLGIWNSSLIIIGPPLIKRIVPPELVTEGLVIFKIVEKIGLFFNPVLLGYIIDNTTWNQGYFGVNWLLLWYASIFLYVVIYLNNSEHTSAHFCSPNQLSKDEKVENPLSNSIVSKRKQKRKLE